MSYFAQRGHPCTTFAHLCSWQRRKGTVISIAGIATHSMEDHGSSVSSTHKYTNKVLPWRAWSPTMGHLGCKRDLDRKGSVPWTEICPFRHQDQHLQYSPDERAQQESHAMKINRSMNASKNAIKAGSGSRLPGELVPHSHMAAPIQAPSQGGTSEGTIPCLVARALQSLVLVAPVLLQAPAAAREGQRESMCQQQTRGLFQPFLPLSPTIKFPWKPGTAAVLWRCSAAICLISQKKLKPFDSQHFLGAQANTLYTEESSFFRLGFLKCCKKKKKRQKNTVSTIALICKTEAVMEGGLHLFQVPISGTAHTTAELLWRTDLPWPCFTGWKWTSGIGWKSRRRTRCISSLAKTSAAC